MSPGLPDPVEPQVDPDVPVAPGGVDAVLAESDVGAASEGTPVTPDEPMSAQRDEADLPDELSETPPPEPPAQETDNTSEPSA